MTRWLSVVWLGGCAPGAPGKGTAPATTPADTGSRAEDSAGTPAPTTDSAPASTAPTSACGPLYGTSTRYAVGGGLGNTSLYRIHVDGEIDEWVAYLRYHGEDVVIQDLLVDTNQLIAISGSSALVASLSPVDGVIDLGEPILTDPAPPSLQAVTGTIAGYFGIENNGRGVWYVSLGYETATFLGNVPLPDDCSGAFDFLIPAGTYPTTQFEIGLNCSYEPINRRYLVELPSGGTPTATFLGALDGDDWLVAASSAGLMEEHHLWVNGTERAMAYCATPTLEAPIGVRGVAL